MPFEPGVYMGSPALQVHGASKPSATCGAHSTRFTFRSPLAPHPLLSFLHVLSFLVLGVFPLMFKLGYYSLKCIKNILSVILMCSEFRERFWALFHLDGKSNRKSSMSALRHSKRLKYTYFKTRWQIRIFYRKTLQVPQKQRYLSIPALCREKRRTSA